MLQIAPKTGDETGTKTAIKEKTDDAIYCARCGHLVTRTRWKIAMGGGERVFTNPAGFSFHVVCFADAPGASPEGEPTEQHTWFAGYLWTYALCKGCSQHLGWHYRRHAGGDQFFGLIKDRLSNQPK